MKQFPSTAVRWMCCLFTRPVYAERYNCLGAAPEDGKYPIFGQLDWETDPTGVRKASTKLNGTTEIANVQVNRVVGGRTMMNISTHYRLAEDDYLELEVTQTSETTLQLLATYNAAPEFGMVKLS